MTNIAKKIAFISFYFFLGAYFLGLMAHLSYESWYVQPLYAALFLGYVVCLPALGFYFLSIGVLRKYLNHLSVVVCILPVLLIGSLLGWWQSFLTTIAEMVLTDLIMMGITPNSIYILTLFIIIATFSYFQSKNYKVHERLFYPFIGTCILAIILKQTMYIFADLVNFLAFIYFQVVYLPIFLYEFYKKPGNEPDIIDNIGK